MKYSFMTFSTPEQSWTEILNLATEYGYDGVEVRIGSGHKHGVESDAPAEKRAEAKKQAAEAGVAICCVATSCRFANPETAPEWVEEAKKAIALAADLGAPCLRVFGGEFLESMSREDAIGEVVKHLSALAPEAQSAGVSLCMETHDAWCHPENVAAVLKQVDHPAIAANWDIMHPIRKGDATMDSAFNALKPWIRHVHFHDGPIPDPCEMKPIGEGEIDHKRAVELLKSMDYQGFLSGEWINWKAPEDHLPQALATMKKYEAEVS